MFEQYMRLGMCLVFGIGLLVFFFVFLFFFQAEDGIRDLVRSRGLGDVYKRQPNIHLILSSAFLVIYCVSLHCIYFFFATNHFHKTSRNRCYGKPFYPIQLAFQLEFYIGGKNSSIMKKSRKLKCKNILNPLIICNHSIKINNYKKQADLSIY